MYNLKKIRGFTLIELMVALLIGLFLIGGVLTLTFAMKRTNAIQSTNVGLQENQRLALNILNDVVQQAGYFPNPVTDTEVSAFPIYGVFATAGQAVYSPSLLIGPLYVRYQTSGTDGVINCLGTTSTVPVTYIAEFNTDGNQNLTCTLTTIDASGNAVTSAPQILATGVALFFTRYGVRTNAVASYQSIDAYMYGTSVTQYSLWPNVISIEVTLIFNNPLYNGGGTAQTAGQTSSAPQSFVIVRTIALMNMTGVNS